jgi:hypothetical protein
VTIWSAVMETLCERRDRLQKDYTLTDNAKKGFDAHYIISKRWRILSSNSLKVEVISDILKRSLLLILQIVSVLVRAGDIRNIILLAHMLMSLHAIFMLILILYLDTSTLFSVIG